ncbi:hypothetical protein ACN6MY_13825 [Peribacillus sp. B-H-3]|uniref:hypothetical protein n=1 Tax=Peribacillus sp. B-H-3 TaxID=3400420 RepID=UPI003B010151
MNDSQDFYKKLKEWGVKTEEELNTFIQDLLNKKDFIIFANQEGKEISPVLKKLQNNMEQLSIIYNFPTKNDVASVAKLAIQIEEKVDKIEETLLELSDQINDIKSGNVETPVLKISENARLRQYEAPKKESQTLQSLQSAVFERLAEKIKMKKIEGFYDGNRMKKNMKQKNNHG